MMMHVMYVCMYVYIYMFLHTHTVLRPFWAFGVGGYVPQGLTTLPMPVITFLVSLFLSFFTHIHTDTHIHTHTHFFSCLVLSLQTKFSFLLTTVLIRLDCTVTIIYPLIYIVIIDNAIFYKHVN